MSPGDRQAWPPPRGWPATDKRRSPETLCGCL